MNPGARVPNNIKLRLKVFRGAGAKNRDAALTSDDLVNWNARGNRNKIQKKEAQNLVLFAKSHF